MDERMAELCEGLLRLGLAPRRVTRALLEIETHLEDLVAEQRRGGATEAAARLAATAQLGTNEALIQRYAAQPELVAWSRRWPALWFGLLPLISYAAVSAAALVLLLELAEFLSPALRRAPVAPALVHGIDVAVRLLFLWLFPGLVAGGFALLAQRRRATLRWPLVGIVATSVLASLLNVEFIIRDGETPGSVGGGIGISLASLPGQFTHVAVVSVAVVVLLRLTSRGLRLEPGAI